MKAMAESPIKSTAEELVTRLQATSTILCTVESCTGGGIAFALTDVAGASSVFWGALITYDNSAKESLALVPSLTLKNFGAVSPPVARALAEGGLARMKQSLEESSTTSLAAHFRSMALSITGIAGPGGGTSETPVGLAYVGIASSNIHGTESEVLELRADPSWTRQQLRAFFMEKCLRLALERIDATSV
jgi:nicotinamide-nucleotide amidase